MEKGEQYGPSESNTAEAVVVQPLWKKNEVRLRHIRGILLEEETKIQKQSLPEQQVPCIIPDDPVYGPYGNPSEGMLCCPICNDYRVSYNRDLKFHLYRELKYKKFLCSQCTVGGSSRLQVLKHVEKQHPKEQAYIREIASNPALEDWVIFSIIKSDFVVIVLLFLISITFSILTLIRLDKTCLIGLIIISSSQIEK